MTGGPKVFFVGAGPGASDLITLRGARAIAMADIVVWAASLVSEEVLAHAREGAEIFDSSVLTLEEVVEIYRRVKRDRLTVARVHSGDPALYGAIQEQIDRLETEGIAWEIVPGVSSLAAAAAALGHELTVPGVSQSVVITRLGLRTEMPEGESVRAFAAHGTTMVLFLSAARPDVLERELLAGGYAPETPCAIVHRASWPDETVIRCRLDDLAARMRAARIHKTALILVGPAIESNGTRSNLYDPAFSHEFRRRVAGGRGARS